MSKNLPIAIDGIVSLGKALDERLVHEWVLRFPDSVDGSSSPAMSEETVLQHQCGFTIAVLSCAETRCEAVLQQAARLSQWRLPLCRYAGAFTASGALVVVASLTGGWTGLAVAAAVATLCTAVVGLFFEFWLAPPQASASSHPVHIRIAQILRRIAFSKGTLEALSGSDSRDRLAHALSRANSVCWDLAKEQTLLADPRTWDDGELAAPLQA